MAVGVSTGEGGRETNKRTEQIEKRPVGQILVERYGRYELRL